MEYLIVNCLGIPNVKKALEDYTTGEKGADGWRLHSCTLAGMEVVQIGSELAPEMAQVSRFMLIMEKFDA